MSRVISPPPDLVVTSPGYFLTSTLISRSQNERPNIKRVSGFSI
ncbi:Uncharacterised protein [Vibrio cholerae]|nr:Uncharacterised protein [Vibrio cholerae]